MLGSIKTWISNIFGSKNNSLVSGEPELNFEKTPGVQISKPHVQPDADVHKLMIYLADINVRYAAMQGLGLDLSSLAIANTVAAQLDRFLAQTL